MIAAISVLLIIRIVSGTLRTELCDDDSLCGPCYECSDDKTRCIPLEFCSVGVCLSDADCLSSYFCNGLNHCEEESGVCSDSTECRESQICDLTIYQCVDASCCIATVGLITCLECSFAPLYIAHSQRETRPICFVVFIQDYSPTETHWVHYCSSAKTVSDCLQLDKQSGNVRCQWQYYGCTHSAANWDVSHGRRLMEKWSNERDGVQK